MGMMKAWATWFFCIAGPCSAMKALNASKTCNGDAATCHLTFDQVTWAGVHNADSVGLRLRASATIGCLTDNHEHHMVSELEEGLRFFDVDTCQRGDSMKICHGPAMGRDFKPEMQATKDWLDANPREVIAISFVNSDPGGDSPQAADSMMEKLTGTMTAVFGDLIFLPEMTGTTVKAWPTVGEMVEQNKRVVVLWGRGMYYLIYNAKDKGPDWRSKHIRLEKQWAMTYSSEYKKMHPDGLAEMLEHFCDDPDNNPKFRLHQPMILADAYLTISAKRKSLSFCNKDLAGDVNPVLLEDEHAAINPLIKMQSNCWKKNKQVSLVAADFAEYYPQRLDTIARALNTRNFAHFGWIGGKLLVSGPHAAASDEGLRALLQKLGGLASADRISVDGKQGPPAPLVGRRLAAGTTVHFSISAPKGDAARTATSNAEVLAKMKAAAGGEAGAEGVTAVCRDPGIPMQATRNLPAQDDFDEGTKLVFTCGATLVAHGNLERTCGPDGIFTGIQPRCLEGWTKTVRLIPFWFKVLLIILVLLSVLCCLVCSIYCCVRKCRGAGKYKELPEE